MLARIARSLPARISAALLLAIGITIDLDPLSLSDPGSVFLTSSLLKPIWPFLASLPSREEAPLLLAFVFALFVVFGYLAKRADAAPPDAPLKVRKGVIALGLLFAFTVVFGYAIHVYESIGFLFQNKTQIVKTVLSFAAWTGTFIVLCTAVFAFLDQVRAHYQIGEPELAPGAKRVLGKGAWIDKRPLLIPFAIMLVAWLPFLIGCYPGLFMGDVSTQLAQFYGLPSWTSNYLKLVDPNVLLNGHHPVLHTLIIGFFSWLGHFVLGSDNLGIFLYVLLQYVLFALTLAYALVLMARLNVPTLIRVVLLAFFALFPMFGEYAVLLTKDVLFACALVLVVGESLVFLLKRYSMTRRDWALLIVGLFGIVFLRNGIILFVVAFAACLLLVSRAQAKQLLAAFGSVVAAWALVSFVILPAAHVTPSGEREVLSIPIQQVARVVSEHDAELTPEQKSAIDGVVEYKACLEDYRFDLSDPVKVTWNDNDITPEEKQAFWNVWREFLVTYPVTCVEATMANYYGYLYPINYESVLYDPYWSNKKIADVKEDVPFLNYSFPQNPVVTFFRGLVSADLYLWHYLPVLNVLYSSPFYTWLLLIGAVYTFRARRRTWPVFVLLTLMFLVFLIGPANGGYYTRYMFPLMVTTPMAILVSLFAKGRAQVVAEQDALAGSDSAAVSEQAEHAD